MEWTDREIVIAKQLSDPEVMEFLRKVFVDIHTQKGEVLEMNVAALDDAEYGRLMKVLYMTREENKAKLNLIKIISNKKQSGEVEPRKVVAPM